MSSATLCPACGREAPIVYRGVVPCCTACGAVRLPLSGPSVNLAGEPSRFGGAVASVLGWVVLAVGGSIALGVALLLLALNWAMAALAIGGPIALLSLLLGVSLLRGGRALSSSAVRAAEQTRSRALLELVGHRGSVTARDAAGALGLGVAEADASLTELAKREPDRLAVDVDDQGVVWYRLAEVAGSPTPRVRVDAGEGERQDAIDESSGARAARPAR